MRMRLINICGLPGSTIFFPFYFINGMIFEKNVIEHSIYQLLFYLFIPITCLQDTIRCIYKEIVTSIAPEDGRVSPKHVELKVHK
jgi:hypothetical protein